MKVILNQTVPKVGKAGTVVTVADGFARNYLFPRGLAILADRAQIESLAKRNERAASKVAGENAAAADLGSQLNGKEIRIEGKVGKDSTKLFGAITNADVAEAVKAQLGITLDKKQIALIDPIKRLGTHEVELDLHRDVDAKIRVVVFDPSAPTEPEPQTDSKAETEAETPAVESELIEA